MNISTMATRQRGKGAIGNVIVLALIGFGVWVGIQFIPQKLEQGTVKSILDDVEKRHFASPIRDDGDLWQVIDRQLLVNEMRDMRPNFTIAREGNGITVRVSFGICLHGIVMGVWKVTYVRFALIKNVLCLRSHSYKYKEALSP